jgi:hypothetical protein
MNASAYKFPRGTTVLGKLVHILRMESMQAKIHLQARTFGPSGIWTMPLNEQFDLSFCVVGRTIQVFVRANAERWPEGRQLQYLAFSARDWMAASVWMLGYIAGFRDPG